MIIIPELSNANLPFHQNFFVIILSIFSVTYLIRGFWTKFIYPKVSAKYGYTLVNIFLRVLYDCIPITLILILHYRNFQEKKLTFNELRKTAVLQTTSDSRSEEPEA